MEKTTPDNVVILQPERIGKNFIPAGYIPEGQDEYYIRNTQVCHPRSGWRQLRSDEVEQLVKNNNTSDSWDNILVTDQFETSQVKNSRFYGLVRIGITRNVILQHHDLRLPAGITNSLIISCDIGDDVAIHDVHYLAHYIIGNNCILFNLSEMHTTDHSKFGNGTLKDGEPENVRTWMDIMNETGCRKVLPFDGMTTADAYLWAKYIDDTALQAKLKEITQKSVDSRRGFYGTTGSNCVIKNSEIVKDVKIGPFCYIKGANKLKNLTINSSEQEPTQIGEGVELVNGIIGYGCHIFYGCKAVKFILGNNSGLKYGARLINSFLGDNSTISCCEVLNNLIFPAHEQHHNNSFLIASVVQGQSNMAAGATIGSNHNSRANDNEIQAGRGFWPGLCTSVKHSCRFASFTLLSKADYPAELDIRLPFSLLSNNVHLDQLEIMPAYWWLYNMYALARNSWKFRRRDKRIHKIQNIEFEALAPDTVEEIITARRLLEIWTAKAEYRSENKAIPDDENMLADTGRQLLENDKRRVNSLQILGEDVENSKRKTVILKAYEGYKAYGEMIHYYAVKNLIAWTESNPNASFSRMQEDLAVKRQKEWVNLGGQIMQKKDVDQLRADIVSGKFPGWREIHKRYNKIWQKYPLDKQKHSWAVLCGLYCTRNLTNEQWVEALDRTIEIQKYVSEQVYTSRKKDFENHFRLITFRNADEMKAALGTVDENSFIVQVRKETDELLGKIEEVKKRTE
jgi:NDP-sugar pyrophosphorylase family protein